MKLRTSAIALLLAAGLLTTARAHPATRTTPIADHHAHLLSPAGAARIATPPLEAVAVPAEVAALIAAREAGWNDQVKLAGLYTDDAVLFEEWSETWIRKAEIPEFVGTRFARAYRITPVSYSADGSSAHLAGYFTRDVDGKVKHFGHVLLALRRGADGAWRIAAETLGFPGPAAREPANAESLIAQLDEAGIDKAVVLSTAYWWGSPLSAPVPDERQRVQAENDWVAAEVSRHRSRLVGFCSFNPLKDYALEEMARCTRDGRMKGLKLHFGNSDVDLKKPEHLARIKAVFGAANARRLPIVAHLWTDPAYGRAEAEIFLAQVLPEAPDIVVQIAHFAGGGPGYTDEALAVYAEAFNHDDPRVRNLYFDIATVADGQTPQVLKTFAERIRQIGPDRVLYGTDMAPPSARQSWLTFRTTTPLTEAEFADIADNVAPYLR